MRAQKTLTRGKVTPTLLRFALPIFAALFLQTLYGGVDLLVVGQFASTADVSGVSTGSILVHALTMGLSGLSMGVTILVGQKTGDRKTEEAEKAILAGVLLFSIIGLLLSGGMVLFTVPLARLLQAPAEAMEQTCDYIRISGCGMLFVVLYNFLGAMYRGLGDSRTPFMAVLIACIFNVFGDLLLIQGFQLGAKGAAMATAAAQGVSVFFSLFMLFKRKLSFNRRALAFHGGYMLTELKLGIPIALQDLLVGVSFVVIQTVVNARNVVDSAGVGIGEKVCGFIMLFSSAFSQAIAAFVAQNIGAGKVKRAVTALTRGMMMAFGISSVIGVFTFLHGDLLAGIFTPDPAVMRAAHEYLKAYAIDTFLTSIMFCFVGFYNGCGKTFFVMVQGLVGAALIRIPLVFLISSFTNATLFQIGLATPTATFVQIGLCAGYAVHLKRKQEKNAAEG